MAPTHCVIEISKSDGELGLYREVISTNIKYWYIYIYILHNIHVKFSTFNHFCSSEIGEQFCKSLSSMLTEESGVSTENQAAKEVIVNSKNMYQTEGSLGSV